MRAAERAARAHMEFSREWGWGLVDGRWMGVDGLAFQSQGAKERHVAVKIKVAVGEFLDLFF